MSWPSENVVGSLNNLQIVVAAYSWRGEDVKFRNDRNDARRSPDSAYATQICMHGSRVMKRRQFLVVAVGGISASVSLPALLKAQTQNQVKIGILTALSGAQAIYGE